MATVTDPWLASEAERAEKQQPHARPLENRAETYSLEDLQHERRQKIKRFAHLARQFRGGQSASADTKRKEHRNIIATDILNDLRMEWAKTHTDKDPFKEPSEAALERMARADQRHRNYVATLENEFEEYILLENEITEINEKIASRRTELECYKAELFLSGGG
jgi:hypothetical protein